MHFYNCCRVLLTIYVTVAGFPPVCTLEQLKNCVEREEAAFTTSSADDVCQSECPVPCTRFVYETSITYGSTSTKYVERNLKTRIEEIKQRNVNAREIQQKVSKEQRDKDNDMVQTLKKSWELVKKIVAEIKKSMKHVVKVMKTALTTIQIIKDKQQEELEMVSQSFEEGYVRPWQLAQESAFLPLQVGMRRFLDSATDQLQILRNTSYTDPSIKDYVRLLLDENIDVNVRLLTRAQKMTDDISRAIHINLCHGVI